MEDSSNNMEHPTKLVINDRSGGEFSLSEEAVTKILEWGYQPSEDSTVSKDMSNPNNRHNPLLVRVVEELGQDASGERSNLVVKEIPQGLEDYYYLTEEDDGRECVGYAWAFWLADNTLDLDRENVREFRDTARSLLSAVGVLRALKQK